MYKINGVLYIFIDSIRLIVFFKRSIFYIFYFIYLIHTTYYNRTRFFFKYENVRVIDCNKNMDKLKD